MCAAFNDMYFPKLVFAHSAHSLSKSDWIVKYPFEAKQAKEDGPLWFLH